MWEYRHTDELYHYGVLGMKWGKRRYQNKDGSLTPAGKKRVSAAYKKQMNKANKKLDTDDVYFRAYNKAANKMNNGMIDKFNKDQEKKHGKNFMNRKGYHTDYEKMFNKELDKNVNEIVYDFYKSNKNFRKAEEMAKKYGMTKWDDLAKENAVMIEKIQKSLNKTSKNTVKSKDPVKERQEKLKSKTESIFKKHPDLYDDFGGPDMIDDYTFFEYVLQEKGYKY